VDAESFLKYRNVLSDLFPEEIPENDDTQIMIGSPQKMLSPARNSSQ
jgi:hypothetical protein